MKKRDDLHLQILNRSDKQLNLTVMIENRLMIPII